MISPPVRLRYVDYSGAEDTGFVVFSWIECGIGDWRLGLRGWLNLRKDLYARYGIPPAYELHATKFIRGVGNPSTNAGWNRRKRNRSVVMREALTTIGSSSELGIGTVYRPDGAVTEHATQKARPADPHVWSESAPHI